MAQTGKVVTIEPNSLAAHRVSALQNGRRLRLLCGLSAIAFLASVALPITIDTVSLSPVFKSALAAGNGTGNGDGQGRGIGNGKGQGDDNRNGGKTPKGGGGDGDDDGDDDTGGADDDDHGKRAADRNDDNGRDGDYGDFDETAYADTVESVDGVAGDELAGSPTTALPTVQQVFALGEGSVLSTEQELLAIQNGWNAQN